MSSVCLSISTALLFWLTSLIYVFFQYQCELNEMITSKWPYQLYYEATGCNYMFVCLDSFNSTMHRSVMWYYNAKYIKSKAATLSQASESLIKVADGDNAFFMVCILIISNNGRGSMLTIVRFWTGFRKSIRGTSSFHYEQSISIFSHCM